MPTVRRFCLTFISIAVINKPLGNHMIIGARRNILQVYRAEHCVSNTVGYQLVVEDKAKRSGYIQQNVFI
jgi:hypothetical protein